MKKIASALALVGALGLFAACGESGDSGAAPEGPATDTTETVDVNVPTADEVVDALNENAGDAPAADAVELKTVHLDIAGMT